MAVTQERRLMVDTGAWVKRLRKLADQLEVGTAFLTKATAVTCEHQDDFPKLGLELEAMVPNMEEKGTQ